METCVHGLTPLNCAYCTPGRYLPPIRTRNHSQVNVDRRSIDTGDDQLKHTPGRHQIAQPAVDPALEKRIKLALIELRSRLRLEKNVPAYVIFGNKTLDDLVTARPKDINALAGIHGLGEKRIAQYGQSILDAIANA